MILSLCAWKTDSASSLSALDRRFLVFRSKRNGHMESAAYIERAFHPDFTAVGLYQTACESHAKSSTGLFFGSRIVASPIRCKQLLLVFLPHANARISDRTVDDFGRAVWIPLIRYLLRHDRDRATGRGVFVRIADEVGHDMDHPQFIAPDQR